MAASDGSDVPLWWIVAFLAMALGAGYLAVVFVGGSLL
jgi:hypothetical protein